MAESPERADPTPASEVAELLANMRTGLIIGLYRCDTEIWRAVLAGAAGRHEMFYEARSPEAAIKMANDHVKGVVLHNVLGRLLS